MKLTERELDCIRFYMGDPEIANGGKFIGGTKAYNTMNAILHKNIVNELDKIKDHKPIEIINHTHLRQMITTIQTIDLTMKKCIFKQSPLVTYRVDRYSEVEAMMKEKRIEGFYSTCKYGYLEEYAKTKQNIVLMEIHRDQDVPVLDFEELFQSSYAKKEEAEILLPYDSVVKNLEIVECTSEENSRYCDMNGNRPRAKVIVSLGKRDETCSSESISFDDLTSVQNAGRISRILKELTDTQFISHEDEMFYLSWKQELKRYLKSAA